MPLTYDPNKWVKAKTAIKEAIDLAEQNGHALYVKQDYKIGNEDANPYPAAGPVRCLRTSLVDWDSRNRRFFWQKRVVKARMVYKTNRYHL